jgi:hypothetical protein
MYQKKYNTSSRIGKIHPDIFGKNTPALDIRNIYPELILIEFPEYYKFIAFRIPGVPTV